MSAVEINKKKMFVVIEVMKSLVSMFGWTVLRFDLQSYNYGNGIEGYAGYLDVEELEGRRVIIRSDGSFEYSEVKA